MADSTTNGIDKVANGEATVSESQSNISPAAKDPVVAEKESVKPSNANNTETAGAVTPPDSESHAENDASTANSKEELTEKADAADKSASEPEKSADPAPPQSTTAETAETAETKTTDAAPLTNGGTKEAPKPVSIEEVRDQDMPITAPSQPAKMTGALPVQEPADETPKADAAPVTTEPEKTEASAGDKRKPSEAEASNGDAAHDEPAKDAPAEKKQKINGATTNDTPKKVGRPRKDKKATPTVGRTARKTRSQGAAD